MRTDVAILGVGGDEKFWFFGKGADFRRIRIDSANGRLQNGIIRGAQLIFYTSDDCPRLAQFPSARYNVSERRRFASSLHFDIVRKFLPFWLPCVTRLAGWKFKKNPTKSCLSVKGALCVGLAEFRCKGCALFIVVCACARLSRDTGRNSLEGNMACPRLFDRLNPSNEPRGCTDHYRGEKSWEEIIKIEQCRK